MMARVCAPRPMWLSRSGLGQMFSRTAPTAVAAVPTPAAARAFSVPREGELAPPHHANVHPSAPDGTSPALHGPVGRWTLVAAVVAVVWANTHTL
jgi:hypothetical protein